MEQKDLSGLQGKTHGTGGRVDLRIRVDDGADGRIHAGLMGGNDADIPAHYLHSGQLAAKLAVRTGNKALRADADPYLLIRHAVYGKNRFLSDMKFFSLHPSLKHIDGRSSQETRHKQVRRIVVNLLRPAVLHQDAVPHHRDMVGNAHGLLLIVGDKNGGDAGFLLYLTNLFPGLQPEPRVQIGKRLVQQKNPGHLDQRPCDRHPLLLAAGKLPGLSVHQLFDLDQLRGLRYPPVHFLLRRPVLSLQIFQREQDILPHGQVRIEGVILKYHSHAPQLRRKSGHILVSEKDPAARRLLQPADHVQRGALSAAGRPEQGDQLSVRDLKGKIIDGSDLAALFPPGRKFFCEILQFDFHNYLCSLPPSGGISFRGNWA